MSRSLSSLQIGPSGSKFDFPPTRSAAGGAILTSADGNGNTVWQPLQYASVCIMPLNTTETKVNGGNPSVIAATYVIEFAQGFALNVDKLVYTGTAPGLFKIDIALAMSKPTNGNDDVTIGLELNGLQVNTMSMSVNMNTRFMRTCSMPAIKFLSPDDELAITVSNLDTNDPLIADTLCWTITRVS